MQIHPPVSHECEEKDKITISFCMEIAKPCSPRMFANTNKAYGLAKHSAINGVCVDPDRLVFTLE